MSTPTQLIASLAGRYRVEREIGRGGMATVYLAHDLRHERRVALKVLNPELGAVLGVERFLAEIRVTANLQHPNLLPLFDSGEADGLLFYVMPYVEGESLRARLEREKQLPIDEAVRIAIAIASALDYAHRHNVIHRDLKPENILLHEGQPLVADFGIALAVSNAGGARVTQTGLSLGTPQYMSPEQATGERGIDSRADIYSLGALTYEMIAGEPPHTGPTAQAIIAKLMTEEPRSLTALRRTVPPHVDDAVQCALEKLPADRPATANTFADALANRTSSRTRDHRAATTRAGRWHRSALPVVAAVAVLATIVAAWALARLERQPVRPVLRNVILLDSLVFDGVLGRLDLSPDGSRIVYVGGSQNQLRLRERSQLQSVSLPGTEGADAPAFSPDGTRIAFFSRNSLNIATVGGGPPITITDSLVGRAGFSWGPDGYLYIDGSGSTPLARVRPQSGATPAWFTTLDSASGETDHLWPDVLPNGNGVVFTIAHSNVRGMPGARIGLADTRTGRHTVLLNGLYARYSSSGHLLYVTWNGTLMIVPFDQGSMEIDGEPTAVTDSVRIGVFRGDFALSRTGSLLYATGSRVQQRELVWISRRGEVTAVDPGWQGQFSDPALSPDGKHVGLTNYNEGSRQVWTKELDTGPALKFTIDTEGRFPSWTPDGRSVAYASYGQKGYRLWQKRADNSAAPERLVDIDQEFTDPQWSSDTQWLVFRTPAEGVRAGDIYGMRPGVDSAPIPIVMGRFQDSEPALSPDGRWLAYTSFESSESRVYVVPFPNTGTAKWLVSPNGGASPAWSHSGRELFYLDGEDRLVSVTVKADPTFSMGRTQVLFRSPLPPAGTGRRQYEVAPDDSRFLTLRSIGGSASERMIIVDNWFEELRPPASKR
jgi:serine/threonine-protein kinase